MMKKHIKYYFSIFIIFSITIIIFYMIDKNKNINNELYIKPVPNPITDLNPKRSRFRIDYMVGRAIMGHLLKSDLTGDIVPGFINDWSVSENGKKFIFKLKKNVKFHSGKMATEDDLIFTFNFLASKNSLISWLFEDVVGYDKYFNGKAENLSGIYSTSPNEIIVELVKPSYVFLSNLADPKIVLLPKDLNGLSEKDFFDNPDGIGPFKFSKKMEQGNNFSLISVQNNLVGSAKIKKIEFKVMTREEAINQFENGLVDDLEMYSLTTEEEKRIKNYGSIYSVNSYSATSLFFNGKSDFIKKNDELRSIISNSVNMINATKKCDIPASESFGYIPKGVIGWSDPQFLINNVQEKKIIKQISKNVTIRLLSYGEDINFCIINELIKQISQTGVKVVHIHTNPTDAIHIFEDGRYDVMIDHLSVRGTEPFHLLAYFSPKSPHDLLKFNDPWLEVAIDRVKEAPIDIIRANFYREIDQYLVSKKNYVIPLFNDLRGYIFSKNVHANSVPAIISLTTGFEEIWKN